MLTMRISGNVRAVILIVATMTLSLVFVWKPQNFHKSLAYSNEFREEKCLDETQPPGPDPSRYLVYSQQCQILDQDPWNRSIEVYFKHSPMPTCSSRPLLSSIIRFDNGTYLLKINKSAAKYYTDPKAQLSCCYSEITRISETLDDFDTDADNKFRYSNCQKFDDEALLSNVTEFIRVKCMQQKERKPPKEVYRDAHAVVPVLPSALKKMKDFDKNKEIRMQYSLKSRDKLNVVIVGIDSVSRLNMRRMMPKTFKYLTRNEWIELSGYTKVGENTMPNLMAIISGLEYGDFRKTCYRHKTRNLDDCPYIWKQFANLSYVTAYAEDTPNISTFNYFGTGFVEKPTDYYLRPFMLAIHSSLKQKKSYGLPVCSGPVAAVDHIFNYARRFLKTFNDYNHFSLFWMNSMSHNNPSTTKHMDKRTVQFLEDLSSIGTYENTVVLLLSDHGTRFGPFRQSFLAYYEERLPFFFIWLPTWFRKQHSLIYNNLRANQNRLTCPYDVHLTLKRILNEDYKGERSPEKLKACPKCVSLFDTVPENRSCEDAAIDLSWCMCGEFKQLQTENPIVRKSGLFIRDFVRNRTKDLILEEKANGSLCSTWTFGKVVRAHEISQGHYNSGKRRQIMILVELNPGKTRFEAIIQILKDADGKNNLSIHRAPSLLTGYSKFSACINTPKLKYYCYCKYL